MRDRGFIKWRPFNSVVPSSDLLKKDIPNSVPNFLEDTVNEYEEILKSSFYNNSLIEIIYIVNNKKETFKDKVSKMDPITKDIYFKNHSKINFRQIIKVKKV